MMKNKKGLQFKSALISLLVVSMCIIAIGLWIGDWDSQYNSGLTYDLDDYDKLDEVGAYASSTQGNISVKSSFEAGSGATNFEGTSLRGAFGIINNIFSAFDVVLGEGGMIDSIEDRWGIPNYITLGIVSIMILAIVFAIIALFFRRATSSA